MRIEACKIFFTHTHTLLLAQLINKKVSSKKLSKEQ